MIGDVENGALTLQLVFEKLICITIILSSLRAVDWGVGDKV